MTEQEKVILKKLSLTVEWQVVTRLVENIIEEIRNRKKLQGTEWDTLVSVIGDECEMKGVRRVIQEVNKASREAK